MADLSKPKTATTSNSTKSFTSTWRIASNKPTEFGYRYRWYVPKFIYSWVMHDLQFIRRNRKLIYKKAEYKVNDLAKNRSGDDDV